MKRNIKYSINAFIILISILLISQIDNISKYLYSDSFNSSLHPRVEVIKLILLMLGGIVALWGLFLNRSRTNTLIEQTKNQVHQLEINEKSQIAQRFKDAIALLKDNNITVRLGAIYSLYEIAKDNKDDYAELVFNLFCAYLREGQDYNLKEDWDSLSREEKSKFKAPESTQAILNFLFSDKNTCYPLWGGKIPDLTGATLIKVNLEGKNLSEVKLIAAKLQMANLKKANFIGTEFWNAQLQGANFHDSLMQGAKLYDANLIRADLSNTFMQGAELDRALLYGACFKDANLQGAKLTGTQFQGAFFENVQFQGTEDIDYDTPDKTKLTDVIINKYGKIANFYSQYIAEFQKNRETVILNPNHDKLTQEIVDKCIIEIKKYCSNDSIIERIFHRLNIRIQI